MNQHPVVLLDPLFRWLDHVVRALWTLHGLRLAVAAPDCVDSEWGLLAEATTIHRHGAARHSADEGNSATIAVGHQTGIEPAVRRRRGHGLLCSMSWKKGASGK